MACKTRARRSTEIYECDQNALVLRGRCSSTGMRRARDTKKEGPPQEFHPETYKSQGVGRRNVDKGHVTKSSFDRLEFAEFTDYAEDTERA